MNHQPFRRLPWSFLAITGNNLPGSLASNADAHALLGFHLAVEDEFLWQSSQPQDFWSGSELVSWLMTPVRQALVERLGPDGLLYPAGGPPRTPSMANQPRDASNFLLAIVPVNFNAHLLPDLIQKEWKKISRDCWTWLADRYALDPVQAALWESQTKRALRWFWQLWPWQDFSRATEWLRKIGAADLLAQARSEPGWLWQANIALLNHRFFARQLTCDFTAWEGQAGVEKDPVIRGCEAIVTGDALISNGRETATSPSNRPEPLLISAQERLGALSVIKRTWLQVVVRAKDNPPSSATEPGHPLVRQPDFSRPSGLGSTNKPMAVMVWTGGAAPRNFTAPMAQEITEPHGWLLRSAPDQGVAWVPAVEAFSWARGFHEAFDADSPVAPDLGVVLPLGEVSFARLIQVAREEIVGEPSEPDLPESSARKEPHLVVRLVDASHELAAWRVPLGSPLLAGLAKIGLPPATNEAHREYAAGCRYVKQLLFHLREYPRSQVIIPGLAEIVLANLDGIGEKNPVTELMRSGCREYLTPANGRPPQCLSGLWNWLMLGHYLMEIRARMDSQDPTA